MTEQFISIDIETNGPIPGENSMLSFGAAAFDVDGKLLSTFSANLEALPGAKEDPDTMNFWSKNQEAYNKTRENLQSPEKAMQDFIKWAKQFENPVIVGYPVFFDYLFVYWYLIKFLGNSSPFSFSAIDIKTYAMSVLKTDYKKSTKKYMPKHWFSESKHTHIALDDAIEQGELFINMLKENLNK